MGEKENRLIADTINSQGKNSRLFRANTGFAWTGTIVSKTRDTITLKNYRPFRAMFEGFPDMFGFVSISVTQDMVGKKIAVFRGVEAKTGKSRLSKMQELFKDMVLKFGGIFDVVRD